VVSLFHAKATLMRRSTEACFRCEHVENMRAPSETALRVCPAYPTAAAGLVQVSAVVGAFLRSRDAT